MAFSCARNDPPAGRGRFRRFLKDAKGAVAIEFALVALPFFFIVANICEQGLIIAPEYSLQRGTENASRLIRIAKPTEAEFRSAICEAAVIVPRCEQRVRLQVRHATKFEQLTTDASSEIFDPGGSNSAVKVRVTYRWRLLFFPFVNFISNTSDNRFYRITAVSVFRNEP